MVTPDEAARLAGVTTRTVYRWIEAGKVHFAETPEGLLLVCPNSLG
jgi:excisionase family DNA binding protein